MSNVAPVTRPLRPEISPAPHLMLMNAGVNPNTGRWTAEYQALWVDGESGVRYDGPWRFVEETEEGVRRAFEFAEPPDTPDRARIRERPEPLTRDETVAMMRDARFVDVEMRSPPDLAPVTDADRVVVFLGRRP